MVPPFHVNPDAFHCLQCTLRMALEGLVPGTRYSLALLDTLTCRRPDEGTWTHAAYLALGVLDVVDAVAVDPFDYPAFAHAPLETLFKTYNTDVAATMAVGFNMVSAAALARVLLERNPVPIERRVPTLADVYRMLDEGWWLIANVNAAALEGEVGPGGHSLLIFAHDGDDLIAHDPGEKGHGKASRRVSPARFERAWSFMGPEHRELLALRGRLPSPGTPWRVVKTAVP